MNMKLHRSNLTILLATVIWLAACSDEQPAATPAGLNGPALIMFYTDN